MQQLEKRDRTPWFIRALAWRNRKFGYPGGRLTEGQIRLIHIHPGQNDKKLKCSLRTVERSSETSYKALSYTWGDRTAKRKISIDGKDFRITCNLYDALSRIREKKWSTWLWADAICVRGKNHPVNETYADTLTFAFQINQADTLERNAQVQQMGETFSGADEVMIWLGDAPDHSCALEDVAYLASLGKNCTIDDVLARQESLFAVFRSSWFPRLWVFQESLLARRNLVLLGSESCFLATLSSLVDATQTHRESLPYWNESEKASEFYRGFLYLAEIIHCIGELPQERRMGLASYYFLKDLIDWARSRICQDPRDHIFGLVGIANAVGVHTLHADYNQSTREVYQDFIYHQLLRDSGSLMFFDNGYKVESDIDLPSWVTDFSRSRVTHKFDSEYRAGGKDHVFELGADSFRLEQGTLVLSGHSLDLVLARTEPLHKISRSHDRLSQWCLAAEDLLKACPTSSWYGAHMSQYKAYWRTLAANCYGDLDGRTLTWLSRAIPPDDDGAAYEILVGRAIAIPHHVNAAQNKAVLEDLEGLKRYIVRTMRARRLLLTHSGYFCSGHQTTEEGDLVVVIPGLEMPLILRKRSNGTSYRLIGPAYVHGIMEGQFMERIEERGDVKGETFYLD